MSQNASSHDIYSLSNLPKNQLWFWIGQNFQPESPIFNMPMAITINGRVDLARFNNAFCQVLKRSDALRTTVRSEQGIPQRYVVDDFAYEVELIDLSDSDDPETSFKEWSDSRCRQIFDLEKRLFDSVLVKLAEDKYVWYWCQHHLVCDGWSTALVYQYVAKFYQASFDTDLEQMPDFPQYENHVKNERDYRQSDEHECSRQFWEKELDEELDSLQLYGKGATEGSAEVLRVTCDLGKERSEALKQLANTKPFKTLSQHMSLFQLFSTCVASYLYRITGNTSIGLGSLYHNRPTDQDKKTIGFFMELAPLRVHVDSNESFESLFSKIKKKNIQVIRHYRYAPGNPMNKRSFDIEFNYNTASFPDFAGMPISVSWLHTGTWYSHEPLVIQVHDFDVSGTFTVLYDFNCGIFNESLREIVIEHFNKCIDAFLENPKQLIGQFNILSAAEEKLLVDSFQQESISPIPDLALNQQFEVQVEKTPDAIVVEYEDIQLTYRQLNERSNQLAYYLRSLGVDKDVMVAVCMERSVEMIVALYAIHKAGGAYVPLDPDHPPARLTFILEEVKSPVLLTQSHLLGHITSDSSTALCLDTEWDSISSFDTVNPEQMSGLDNLAYVIYTSGSTGEPKGVMINQLGVVNYLAWLQNNYPLDSHDRVLLKTAYSFDPSVPELFWAPTVGGSIVISKPGGHQDVTYLADLIEKYRVSVLFWVPSMLQLFLDKIDPAKCNSLKLVTCGGEVMSVDLKDKFLKSCKAVLLNVYGPTETVVAVTSMHCKIEDDHKVIPIGKPVSNTQIYLLDEQLNPVPTGSPGELYVGGLQLARGYLNQPELTRKKFIANPFSKDENSRIYKTGDLARFVDGQIEYLDRVDFQVKIRGLRIELGEIESKLAECDGIKQSVVIVREDIPGDKRIAAYYETDGTVACSASELRSQLKQSLPGYMVPQYFVEMDNLPLSANEKIDRKALPKPLAEDSDTSGETIEASTDTEKALVKIWRELIGNDQISIDANFFDLGGHSLLAMQAISEVSKSLQFDIPVASMITDTLEQIAATIDGGEAKDAKSGKSTVQPENSIPFYFGDDNAYYGHYSKPGENQQSLGAVLLCNPTFMEGINAHGAYRRLATLFGNAGYHVLRFDYFATGNSLGDDSQGSIEQWIKDIQVAADKLRELSGFEFISLVGLRYGAILAAHAAVEKIDNLILWEPVFSGSEYLCELGEIYQRVTQELNVIRVVPVEKDHCEIVGYDISEDLRQSFNQTELINGDTLSQARRLILLTSDIELRDKIGMDRLKDKNPSFVYSFVEDSYPLIREFSNLVTFLPGKSLNEIVNLVKGGSK